MMRPVFMLGGLVVLCGLMLVVTTACGGEDDEVSAPSSEENSTSVEWAFPPGRAAAVAVTEDQLDAFFTEDRLRDAPNADELPILEGSPDDSADPDEGTDGPSVSVPPAAPGGEPVPRSALAQPPTGVPAVAQARPWPYQRKRWSGRHDTLPMSTSGTFFIRHPANGQIVQWCSGTVVPSKHKSLVWTAAHCLYDPKKQIWFNTDVVFVPGFNRGNRPSGVWSAKRLAVHQKWMTLKNGGMDWAHDVAVVVLEPKGGQYIQDAVGAQGIYFNLGRGQAYVSNGYPVDAPFNGDSLFTCSARFGNVDRSAGSPASTGIGCDMTGGSSGGGWLIGLGRGGIPGAGWVFSVNSYGYGNTPEMYGPYHGDEALTFWRTWS